MTTGAPIGYAVQMEDGPFVGIWRDQAEAEAVRSKQPSSHNDRVVPVYAGAPPAQHPVWRDVAAEMMRAVAKFPTWPTDPLHALAVVGEEFGELTKEVLQFVYEPNKTTPEHIRAEAIQTAAMAIRFAISLDRYAYRPGAQHTQQVIDHPSTRKDHP